MANGKPGPPLGNKNATVKRPWADAIRRALARYKGGKVDALNALADRIVKAAVDRMDWDAIHEIANRLDGKPRQQTELIGGDDGAIQIELVTDAANQARQKIARLLAKAIIEDTAEESE